MEDVSQLVNSYTPSGRFCGGSQRHPAPAVERAEALWHTFEQIFRERSISLKISKVDFSQISGDTACLAVTSAGEVTTKSTGASTSVPHRHLFYFTNMGGEWKIQLYMFNESGDGSGAEPSAKASEAASGSGQQPGLESGEGQQEQESGEGPK